MSVNLNHSIIASKKAFREEFWNSCDALKATIKNKYAAYLLHKADEVFSQNKSFQIAPDTNFFLKRKDERISRKVNPMIERIRKRFFDAVSDDKHRLRIYFRQLEGNKYSVADSRKDEGVGRLDGLYVINLQNALRYLFNRFEVQCGTGEVEKQFMVFPELSFRWDKGTKPIVPNPLTVTQAFRSNQVTQSPLSELRIRNKTKSVTTELYPLAQASPYFAKLFRTHGSQGTTIKTDADRLTVKMVLKQPDQTGLSNLSEDRLLAIYRLSHNWKMSGLRDRSGAEIVERRMYDQMTELQKSHSHPLFEKTLEAQSARKFA